MNDACIKLPVELFALSESEQFRGELSLEGMVVGPDEYRFLQPLAWSVDITNTGDAFLVTGKVRVSAQTACARCLKPVDVNLCGEIEEYYLIHEDAKHPADIEKDELEILSTNHVIDLRPHIDTALLVATPAQPLCCPDCKGLCSQCGADLNQGACSCTQTLVDDFNEAANPFSVLKNYRFDDESKNDGTSS